MTAACYNLLRPEAAGVSPAGGTHGLLTPNLTRIAQTEAI